MFHNARPSTGPLRTLRETIARIERAHPAHMDPAHMDPTHTGPAARVAPIGVPDIDQMLAGGLTRGALHEAMGAGPDTEHAAAATLFMASVLARLDGPILWVLRQADLFAPGLAGVGLSPDRVIFAEAGRDVLAAMEEGLRHRGLTSVVGEVVGRLSLVASRRLHLAAEQAGVLAIVLRRSRGFDDPVLTEPTAAVTRWRVAALPSAPVLAHASATPGLGRACWRLDLLRCRGGVPGAWIVEEADATGCLTLVAEIRDRPAAQAGRRSA